MIYGAIALYIAVGVVAVVLSCGKPHAKRYRIFGWVLLTAAGAGFLGTAGTAFAFYAREDVDSSGKTLFILFFLSLLAAVAVCVLVDLAAVFINRRLIKPLAVLVPFIWGIPLLLWTRVCMVLTSAGGYFLTLGISLCALLLLCPAVAFLRAAAALDKDGVLQERLDEIAGKKEKRAAKKARRMQKQRLRAPRKNRETKKSSS